jgi:hypothetical protein
MTPDETKRNKGIRKTTLILAGIATAVYLGFILQSVLQA